MKNYLGIAVGPVDLICMGPIPLLWESLKTGQSRTPISSRGLTHEGLKFSLWMVVGEKGTGYHHGRTENRTEA